MPSFKKIIETMPPAGLRLPGGLAIRITNNEGFYILGASRIDNAPSDTEMVVIKTAVIEVHDPPWLFESVDADIIGDRGVNHYIRRLYWPIENIKMIHGTYRQAALSAAGIDA